MPSVCKERVMTSVLENWDFMSSKSAVLDNIHPYPAKFIRELPDNLINIIEPKQNTYIMDPFCGSGTSLVVAQQRGYKSIGIDLNPIACLISRVKTSTMRTYNSFDINIFLERASSLCDWKHLDKIPNLVHWFKPHVIDEISRLVHCINIFVPRQMRDIYNLALSSIIVRVSNQESDTRYAAIDKNIPSGLVFSLFQQSYEKIINALKSRDYFQHPCTIYEHNALRFDKKKYYNKVGGIITSPPYPNAYEYWLYHKYRMFWLGKDPISVKKEEIGARAHFFKRNHHSEENFVFQMEELFAQLHKYLLNKSCACFVIGRSKIHGKLIDNAEIIIDASKKYNFVLEHRFERTLHKNKKSFNLSHANIKTETVIILRKYERQT